MRSSRRFLEDIQTAAVRTMSLAQWFLISFPIFPCYVYFSEALSQIKVPFERMYGSGRIRIGKDNWALVEENRAHKKGLKLL